MKNTFKLFVTLFLLAFALNSYATQPNYDMSIRNLTMFPSIVNGSDSVLQFDVFIVWTNSTDPTCDPFEFGASQMNITFNPAIGSTGTLTPSKVAISGGTNFPSSIQNPTFQIVGNLFQASSNNPNGGTNFMISTIPPGNRMLRIKIRTSGHQYPVVTPDLRFQLTPPNNTFCAYFMPPLDPKDPDNQLLGAILDTVINHYTTESNDPLPVELASFTSTVNRNNVALAWATARETNNQGFDIERSVVNSNEWAKVGYVTGNGTTNETKNYTFTERVSTGKYSYRLKQIDFNGNTEIFALNNEVEVGVPSTYAMSQNYPNPFNPATKIDYELPYDGKVSILLYDISGREVGKLVNEVKTAGYYTVQFNASNLASGMYFYRINAQGNSQNFVSTKKMVLIK